LQIKRLWEIRLFPKGPKARLRCAIFGKEWNKHFSCSFPLYKIQSKHGLFVVRKYTCNIFEEKDIENHFVDRTIKRPFDNEFRRLGDAIEIQVKSLD
jgi:hypothetical protein